MQVSVFPDSGTAFAPITTSVKINLEAKVIGGSTKSFIVPSPSATAVKVPIMVTLQGATALAASTLAVAAAASALY